MRVFCDFDTEHSTGELAAPAMANIKAVVAFASAKGGVGKSSLVANVAAALALKGRKIGILDADLNAPVIATMLGMNRVKAFSAMGQGIEPAAGPLGLRVIASNLVDDREPVLLGPIDEEPHANGIQAADRSERGQSGELRHL